MTIKQITENYPEIDFLVADGFDKAMIGFCSTSFRLIYSIEKCIEILMKDMDYTDATEYFSFNVQSAYVGEKTPIWMYTKID